MAHYAFLDEDNIVVEVIVGIDENQLIEDSNPEDWYAQFKGLQCVRTSYNSKIRGTFAAVGHLYDEAEDVFVVPQPFESWTRNGSFWQAPIEMPEDGKIYLWDETAMQWIENE
jgi:hypothetical protein